jgi:hypothetical protein
LGSEDEQGLQLPLLESFTTIFESFEQNLKDECARRAAKDNEILAELRILRANSLGVQELKREDRRIQQELETANESLRRLLAESSRSSPSFQDSSASNRTKCLSKECGRLSKQNAELRLAISTLLGQRKKDAEVIQEWEKDRENRASKRRHRPKEAAGPPIKAKSSPLIRAPDNRLSTSRLVRSSPLSRIELPPAAPAKEPIIVTIPSEPDVLQGDPNSPMLFDELNLEPMVPTDQVPTGNNRMSFQCQHHDNVGPSPPSPELPPVSTRRNTKINQLQPEEVIGSAYKDKSQTQSSISTSSQKSAQNDIGDDTTLLPLSSSSPILMFARSLKRKRRDDGRGQGEIKQNGSDSWKGGSENPIRVKSEQGSSSPVMNMRTQNSQVLDLDDVDGKVTTPRKNQCHTAGSDSTGGLVPAIPLGLLSRQHSFGRSTSAPPASQSQRHHQVVLHDQNPFPPVALLPIDKNLQSHPRSTDHRANRTVKRYKRDPDWGIAAIPLVSEDGEYDGEFNVITIRRTALLEAPSNGPESGIDEYRDEHREVAKGRLNPLLETRQLTKNLLTPIASSKSSSDYQPISRVRPPMSPKPKFTPRPGPQSLRDSISSSSRAAISTPSIASPSRPRSSNNRPVFGSSGHSRNSSRSPNEAEDTNNPRTPLRNLPVERLTTENFKINPARNKGMRFAYAEVVRGRDQRKCLPGCTRPECCGAHFRRLIEMGFQVRPDKNLWATEGKDEGVQLIIEYTNWARSKIKSLSEDDRDRLLIDAKIQKTANLFGKHRHLHERPASPPGFWRTDFPSTQERNEDRALADEMERQKVEARWREAKKDNGLWKFADE